MTPMTSDDQLERWLADNMITDMALRGIARAAWNAALAYHAPSESAAQPTDELAAASANLILAKARFSRAKKQCPSCGYTEVGEAQAQIEHNDH